MTEAYRKAYKQYIIFSALLISSQLIGINAEQIPYLGTILKNPTYVSFVLTVLVIYSWFKFRVEWNQCDLERRWERWVKRDHLFAHWAGACSLAVYFYQTSGQTELLGPEQRTESVWKLLWFISVLIVTSALTMYIDERTQHDSWRLRLLMSGLLLVGLFIILLIAYLHGISNTLLVSSVPLLLMDIYTFTKKRRKQKQVPSPDATEQARDPVSS